MSQPFDRSATCEAPGKINAELGEFWVKDPFQINFENNLSSYERNRVYLNAGGENFLEISRLTGADSDADSRAVVAADLRRSGQMDLILRSSGGGPLRIYQNDFPTGNALTVRLRGRASNRQGIGARLELSVGARRIYRDQFPVNSYRSQAPNEVHFGIGEATKADRLTIRWPSGKIQTLNNLKTGHHLLEEPEK